MGACDGRFFTGTVAGRTGGGVERSRVQDVMGQGCGPVAGNSEKKNKHRQNERCKRQVLFCHNPLPSVSAVATTYFSPSVLARQPSFFLFHAAPKEIKDLLCCFFLIRGAFDG